MLVVSLQAGDIRGVSEPSTSIAFLNSLRAALPLIAGYLAVMAITVKLFQHSPRGIHPVGPIGFTIAYGLVGAIGAVKSPSLGDSFYWAAAYLSVPVVLWAIVWGSDGLAHIQRIILVNWLIVCLAILALFVTAVLYLNLGSVIVHPGDWLECRLNGASRDSNWFLLTEGKLRPTGVGRYAALAAVLALGGMWQRRWRSVCFVILIVSLILLFTSGARSALVGFAAAAPLVVLLHGGKRAILSILVAVAVLTPVVWGTGIYKPVLEKCLLLSFSSSQRPQADATASVPTIEEPLAETEDGLDPTIEEPLAETGLKVDFTLTGRTWVWEEGLRRLKDTPASLAVGYGFHADRLVLQSHMHNAFLHSTFQAGIIGASLFLLALLWGWVLVIGALRRMSRVSAVHKSLIIQGAGVLTFFTFRGITESSGAFFGVDWLLMAPILVYFQLIRSHLAEVDVST